MIITKEYGSYNGEGYDNAFRLMEYANKELIQINELGRNYHGEYSSTPNIMYKSGRILYVTSTGELNLIDKNNKITLASPIYTSNYVLNNDGSVYWKANVLKDGKRAGEAIYRYYNEKIEKISNLDEYYYSNIKADKDMCVYERYKEGDKYKQVIVFTNGQEKMIDVGLKFDYQVCNGLVAYNKYDYYEESFGLIDAFGKLYTWSNGIKKAIDVDRNISCITEDGDIILSSSIIRENGEKKVYLDNSYNIKSGNNMLYQVLGNTIYTFDINSENRNEYYHTDLNMDKKVDLVDLSLLASSYNNKREELYMYLDNDVNYDDIIDLYDLVEIAKDIK